MGEGQQQVPYAEPSADKVQDSTTTVPGNNELPYSSDGYTGQANNAGLFLVGIGVVAALLGAFILYKVRKK